MLHVQPMRPSTLSHWGKGHILIRHLQITHKAPYLPPPPPKKKRAHRVWQNLPVNGENTEENTATQKRGNYKEMYGFSVRPYIS